jgi:hypothetical protein
VKTLRLVPPHTARRLGIPSVGPTFLSAQTYQAYPCRDHKCLITYSPLVYRVGHVTEAQHFHERDGGIAFYRVPHGCGPIPSYCKEQMGWAAFVEPLGTVLLNEGLGINRQGRCSAVRVLQIVPWCKYVVWELHRRWRHPSYCHQPHVLESGWLCHHAHCEGIDDELLIPCCTVEGIPPWHVRWRFEVREDAVICRQCSRTALWTRWSLGWTGKSKERRHARADRLQG